MIDSAYKTVKYRLSELEHDYGKNVHILSDPFLLSQLAKLCSQGVYQPLINQLVEELYSSLVKIVLNTEFPKKFSSIPTRMVEAHPQEGVFHGELLDTEQAAVAVDLARAGTYPSHICYSTFNYVLNPQQVRQDHIYLNRQTNESHKVVGTKVSGHKIGGGVKDAIVVFPDPMGATGGTLVSAVNIYKEGVEGPARKYIALHLIVTPEYLRKVTQAHPDLVIYAVRLDRGLSSQEVLNSRPGSQWQKETGLNQNQYIVPGGGGFGEILNNSFV